MQNIAIMCSGGDASGMNPAIKKFVDIALKKGYVPFFVFDGLEGLIDGKIKQATHKDVATIMHLGGTIIRSSRSKRFFQERFRKQAYENLRNENISTLVVLGGNGSFAAMRVFSQEYPIRCVAIPATIDSDVYGTSYCLGVDTALNVIRDAIDKIKDTAGSFNRAFVVEVMGRDCGYLAAVSALTSGAELCVIPEETFPKEQIRKKLLSEFSQGRTYLLGIVAEGTRQSESIAQWIETEFSIETRISILGHIQRGGNPSVKDRLTAFEFILKAFEYIERGDKESVLVAYDNAGYDFLSLQSVVEGVYELPRWLRESLFYLD